MAKWTQKRIRRFLEWCGITAYYEAAENDSGIIAWICPLGSEKTIPYYGLTPDFLFKYAVPKFISRGVYEDGEIRLYRGTDERSKYWYCHLVRPNRGSVYAHNKDLTLALAEAIEEVLDKEAK